MACFTSSPLLILLSLMQNQATDRVSLDEQGQEASGSTVNPAISEDGRHVAYQSTAALASGAGPFTDVYVRDRMLGTTTLLSKGIAGMPSNALSLNPSISGDGRFVVFYSAASNLVTGDTNLTEDVFLVDRDPDLNGSFDEGNNTLERVSIAYDGSEGNAPSDLPVVSDDGRWVVFWSAASNLVPGDTNGASDIFVRDRQLQTTLRLSEAPGDVEGIGASTQPSMSPNGRYVVFATTADNLIPGDTNGLQDILLLDRDPDGNGVYDEGNHTLTLVSGGYGGAQADNASAAPDLSDDASMVVFESSARNLLPTTTSGIKQIYLHDLTLGQTSMVSRTASAEGNDRSELPVISGDGHYVAFQGRASNLVAGDTNGWDDIFLANLQAGTLQRWSVDGAGGQAASFSQRPAIANIGPQVAFNSPSGDLVPHDNNNTFDVFVHGTGNFAPQLVVGSLVRGQAVSLYACNCRVSDLVVFLYSVNGTGSGPCPPYFGGTLCLDLLNPVTLLGTATADPLGAASFTTTVPTNVPLIPVYCQIAIRRGPTGADSVMSQVMVQVIQP